jgi:hypothetical protein
LEFRDSGLGFRDSGLVPTFLINIHTLNPSPSPISHISLTHSLSLPPSPTLIHPHFHTDPPSLSPQLILQVIGTVNGVAQTCASLASAMAPAFAGNVFSYSLQVSPNPSPPFSLHHHHSTLHVAIQSSTESFIHPFSSLY